MTTDVEKAFKAKLRNIAKETNRNPADLWQSLVLERFLVRLSLSPYRHHFILKGGVLLSKYLPIGRETQDLDFLSLAMSNTKERIKKTFSEIAGIGLNDGFLFKDLEVAELAHAHMAYAGVAVSMIAHFGRTRFPVAVDIGFGDTVAPIDKQIALTHSSKGALFEENISLLCYPPEFIFAEKLETLVYRGGDNSRMKDFHDLHTMLKFAKLSYDSLRTVIPAVFEHRQTPLTFPVEFSDSDILLLQSHWTSYRARLPQKEAHKLPLSISELIDILNEKLAQLSM
jgi:predicted nucleotidyltransferase component of viral defense system